MDCFGPYSQLLKAPSASTTTAAASANTSKPKPEKNLRVLHKKTNLKFSRPIDDQRGVRAVGMEERRKNTRTKIVMTNRPNMLNAQDMLDSPSSNSQNSNSDASNTDLAAKSRSQAEDRRREKLMKWQKEKAAMSNPAVKRPTKPPFKAGPSNNTAATTTTGNDVSKLTKAPRSKANPTVAAPERRVTRAMARKEPTKVLETNLRPPINKMKNLAINNQRSNQSGSRTKNSTTTTSTAIATNKNVPSKTVATASSKVSKAPASKPVTSFNNRTNIKKIPENGKKVVHKAASINSSPEGSSSIPSSNSSSVLSTTGSSEPSSASSEVKENIAVPAPVVKRLKPKAIDATYIEYNGIFSKACESLNSKAVHWRPYVEDETVPENIREDIMSGLGQIKLLLESKLPQFGQLLYSYLCKEADPAVILLCDLQGWWDVAVIQVDAVLKRFEQFEELKKNNWIEKKPEVMKSAKKIIKKSSESSGEKPAVKAVASKGIKEFLMQKRKLMMAKEAEAGSSVSRTSSEIQTPDSEMTDVEKTPAPKSPPLQKTFEGVFFSVSSPVAKISSAEPMKTRNSFFDAVVRSSSESSPRRLSTRTSLRMLSVRNSMGSICKIGARPLDNRTESKTDIPPSAIEACEQN